MSERDQRPDRPAAEHPVELTPVWIVVLLAIFAPLGVWRNRSMSR
jgi:hypothetical protein